MNQTLEDAIRTWKILLSMLVLGPKHPKQGICANFHIEFRREGAGFAEGMRIVGGLMRDVMRNNEESPWASDDIHFPIAPAKRGITAEEAYASAFESETLWTGKYGDNRRAFLEHLVAHADDLVGKCKNAIMADLLAQKALAAKAGVSIEDLGKDQMEHSK